MNKTITILIPCFNSETFLEDALQSIVNQSYRNIIVMLLDDGSTDQSLEIMQRFAESDPRVKVHQNITNMGIIGSRNRLLDLCETELAAWMDADDIAASDRIEKQLALMTQDPDLVACSSNFLQLKNGQTKAISLKPVQLSKEYLLFYNHVLNPGSMFSNTIAKQNNIRFRTWISGASDYQFWVEMSQFGKIGLVQENLMTYRVHDGQESSAQQQRQFKGCLETVQAQLLQFNCDSHIDDLARLLVYPALALRKEFQLSHLKNSEKIVRKIIESIDDKNFDQKLVKKLLLEMFRKQAWRVGVLGFYHFVRLFGYSGLKDCRYFGANLLWYGVRSDFQNLGKAISIRKEASL